MYINLNMQIIFGFISLLRAATWLTGGAQRRAATAASGGAAATAGAKSRRG